MLPSKALSDKIRKAIKQAFTSEVEILLPNAGALDSYNLPTQVQAPISVPCSFTNTPNTSSWEQWLTERDIQTIDAEMRFLPPPIPDKSMRIRLIKVLMVQVEPIIYEVVGIRNLGRFGYICALKAVLL